MKKWVYQFPFNFLHSFVELIYPSLCVVCGKSLVNGEKFICSTCLADFPFSDHTFFSSDKLPIIFGNDTIIEDFYSLFYYHRHSEYRNLIYALKYRSRKNLGVYLGCMLGERIGGRADCIIPVPLHKKRERKRGFNQSYQIAMGIGKILGIEIINDVIFRVHNNVSQTGKTVEERQQNVENIFELRNAEKIEGKHILLVDDVITTGATVCSCMKVLAKAGGVKFSIACLAHTISM